MQNTIQHVAALPTGNWLSQERLRLGKTRAEVAKAVRRHSATLRSIEQHNRVLPPGWYPVLRALGMQFQETAWPSHLLLYTGADLYRDLRTCSGLQNSRYWLSEQLCVSENEVSEVVRGNLPVPQSWLLKLAELGACVPAFVRMALYPPASAFQHLGPATAPRQVLSTTLRPTVGAAVASDAAPSSHVRTRILDLSDIAQKAPLSLGPPQGQASAPSVAKPIEAAKSRATFSPDSVPAPSVAPTSPDQEAPSARPTPAAVNEPAGAPVAISERRERFSLFFHCTEEEGLYFSVSVPPIQTEAMKRVMEAICGAAEAISHASTSSAG